MTQNEPLQPTPKSDADLLLDFLVPHMQHRAGTRVAWEIIYEWYADWWGEGPNAVRSLSVAEFGAALAEICELTPIRVHKARGRVWCLDVRLIDPSVRQITDGRTKVSNT